MQLVLEGHAAISPRYEDVGKDIIGLDIGPSTLAMVPQEGAADLVTFCEELAPTTRKKRQLQRKMDRQRRANNPDNYDQHGRVKKGRRRWKESKRYQATRRQHANTERRLAAHHKSLHGHLAHRITQVGTTISIEKTSFKAWQKQYGRSIGPRAPGLFVAHLTRLVAKTGGTPHARFRFPDQTVSILPEVGGSITRSHDHSVGTRALVASGRCSVICMRRSRLSYLEPEQTIPSITQHVWEGAEPRLRAVMEDLQQRANEGQRLPRSMGVSAPRQGAARAGARRLKNPADPHQEPIVSLEPIGSGE